MPAGVKMTHIFAHQHHKVCLGGAKVHIHKVDLDCEFQKFSITHNFQLSEEFHQLLQTSYATHIYDVTYKFLNNHRHITFSLRGPPVLV